MKPGIVYLFRGEEMFKLKPWDRAFVYGRGGVYIETWDRVYIEGRGGVYIETWNRVYDEGGRRGLQ